ncbi:unnamed protein product, partial [Prorocentrum cordatum]
PRRCPPASCTSSSSDSAELSEPCARPEAGAPGGRPRSCCAARADPRRAAAPTGVLGRPLRPDAAAKAATLRTITTHRGTLDPVLLRYFSSQIDPRWSTPRARRWTNLSLVNHPLVKAA